MRKVSILAALLLLAPGFALSEARNLQAMLVEKGVIAKGDHSDSRSNASKVYWNGGTKVDFPDNGFTFGINTLLQTRYTFSDNDEDVGANNTSSFDVTNARIIVSGTALNEEFKYVVESDVSGNGSGTNDSNMLDAYIQWNYCDDASVRLGQFKTGISRQYLTSEQNLMFADRSSASDLFSQGRNQGIAFNSKLMDGAVSAGLAMFNGTKDLSDGEGINSTGTDNNHFGVLNLRYNVFGEQNVFVESDYEANSEGALSIGAAYGYGQGSVDVGAGLQDADTHLANVDFIFKQDGLSLAGEWYWQRDELDNVSGSDINSQGGYVQAGMFVVPKEWELAARYGFIDCDDGLAGGVCSGFDKINEVTAGVNYYWWANHMKASFNYSFLNQDMVGTDDNSNTNRWLLQLSAYL